MMLWFALLGCRETMLSGVDPRGAPARWNAALHDVVTADGYVDYDRLQQRRGDLDAYVAWLALDESTAPPRGKARRKTDAVRNRRHAFWINAYNALTLFQVMERGRPASVLDTPGWLPMGGSGFFIETQFETGAQFQSLSEIEHERLRMRELDYRDHAAINCASTSCPPLRAGLYDADRIEAQLDEQMARWVADRERGLRFDGETLVISPIFEWFAEDFRFTSGGLDVCTVAAQHAAPPLRERLLNASRRGCPHTTFEYDWTLNDRTAQ